MLSAPAVKKAEKAIDSAKKAVRELLMSREWENGEQKEALLSMLSQLERTAVDFTKLECCVYGFETWRYLSEEAIKAERWKELEAGKEAALTLHRKQLANQHCKAMGLEIPYPEAEFE